MFVYRSDIQRTGFLLMIGQVDLDAVATLQKSLYKIDWIRPRLVCLSNTSTATSTLL